ncbi:acyl-CoA/acyl-ACP dehydrogenase [Roseomonas sp. NAR14]|uniref:Acyl-CoA/acyl-ACP dehydrogenase n=1 Tax=Roseomonas acroporae TaxID=2937791 RepID=A0A9X2BSQ3_9PROT|nr:acyl-CoA dehydrogenase family protein [Roseomonas acroporae]MCK8783372.1 acyl-CoA/acyl-ACP dehydrogenase [Roseomonas acroporae]
MNATFPPGLHLRAALASSAPAAGGPLDPAFAPLVDAPLVDAPLADAPGDAVRRLLPALSAGAEALDRDGAFPAAELALLGAAGLLAAPLPATAGGAGLGTDPGTAVELAEVLRLVGRANLSLGRLYEGHVNTLRLVHRHGDAAQRRAAAADARAGLLFAVWNTDDAGGLHLEPLPDGRFRLRGRKILCSGAGFAERGLVTARLPGAPERQMLLLPLTPGERADLAAWTPTGMRASATGAMDFTGLEIGPECLIGGAGDYVREPDFSAGAWRFAAVHLGGIEALVEALRAHLRRTGRGEDPHQLARLGLATIAAGTARLWVEQAARLAEGLPAGTTPERAVAGVQLARLAVERAALDALELAQRSIGLGAFMRPNPAERIARDLATYLRQPMPDHVLAQAARHALAAPEAMGDLW